MFNEHGLLLHCVPKSSTPSSIDNFVNSQRIFKILPLQTLWKICNKTVIKVPITPKMCCHTTLWNIPVTVVNYVDQKSGEQRIED